VATAEAIVQAVSKIVSVRGVRGVTIRAVAETAGVGMGSLYQFFPTRDALILAWEEQILLSEIAPVAARLMEASAGKARPDVVLPIMVQEATRVFKRIVAAHGPGAENELLARYRVREALSNRMEELVANVLEHGDPALIRARPSRAAARLIVRTICYVALDHALADVANTGVPAVVDEATYLGELVEMIQRYIGQVEGAA
jgi:AcrR family transcriptional regulator